MPRPVLLLVAACAVLVAHSLLFNFVTDDAFISFVYARNLVEHGRLVWNVGEKPVEGYTNFLWTLLIALGLLVHVPAELSSRVLGTLSACITLFVCALLLRWLRGGRNLEWRDAVPALVLAGVPGYACWSSGGLETQLFTLLVTLGASLYLAGSHSGRLWPAALAFGLSALTRPEGYLFFGLTALHRLVSGASSRRQGRGWAFGLVPRREELAALGLFLILTVPHLVFRRLYYGYWAPNTYYIKSAGGSGAWAQGGFYLLLFARESQLHWLTLLSLVAALFRGESRYRAALCYTLYLTGVFLLYVASVGGDFMGLHRFLMPVVPQSVVLGCAGLFRLLDAQRVRPLARVCVLVVAFAVHGANAYRVDRRALTFLGADRGIDTPGYLKHYTRDRALIGQWLGRHVQPDDYQVVGGAGAQVYYARIPALDSFGLSDEHVAHHVPPVSNRPGHQKFAPLDYVLSKRPTIITYNVYRIGPAPYEPSLEEARTWRGRGFHYVSVRIPGLSQPYYSFLKRIDRRLGPLPPADDID